MKHSLKTVILAASLSLTLNAYPSGVPTIDSANMGQMIMQFERLGEQLTAMTENVSQVTQTAQNFIGQINYYKDLISNIEFRQVADGYIPINASEVLAIINDGVGASNPELQKTIDSIMNSSPALEELSDSELKSALIKSRQNMAYYQAAFQEAYTAAGKRQAMAHQLIEESSKVSTEKEARALGLAMQGENIIATNEVARLLTMQQMKHHEEEIREANEKAWRLQRSEARLKAVTERITGGSQ